MTSDPIGRRPPAVDARHERSASGTYRGTAAWLGQPEGTVKSRIRSGLRRLNPILADLAADPDRTAPTLPRRSRRVVTRAGWRGAVASVETVPDPYVR